MNHLSLFSGIGGLDLAAEWAGFTTIGFVERDKFCQQVLRKHWPNVPIINNIQEVSKTRLKKEGIADIKLISGGFPCPPVSHAGKRLGEVDNRYLWPEMLRVIREVKPAYVVAENVYGLVTHKGGLILKNIYTDLETEGYEVAPPVVFPAAAVGAFHRRDRVWICAYSGHNLRSPKLRLKQKERAKKFDGSMLSTLSNLDEAPCPVVEIHSTYSRESRFDREIERNVRGMAYGVSRRVDRLRALGNAVVPQQAFQIFSIIAKLEKEQNDAISSTVVDA